MKEAMRFKKGCGFYFAFATEVVLSFKLDGNQVFLCVRRASVLELVFGRDSISFDLFPWIPSIYLYANRHLTDRPNEIESRPNDGNVIRVPSRSSL
jgi:hypothetical protein